MNEAMPLLQLDRVSMSFGQVRALDDVSLRVEAGAVTCLIGDNGAGKSTLIRVLSGVHRPTAGRVLLEGHEVIFDSPRAAQAKGIATVHQDLALIPLLSVWRNFFLGVEPGIGRGPLRRIDVARCRQVVRESLAGLGIELRDPDQPVGTLSGGERQCIAIARAVHLGARVLILDEPTAALGVKQSEIVLRLVGSARDRGIAVLLITHSPQQALEAGDRFVVLERGRVVRELARSDASLETLVTAMAGRYALPQND